MADALISLHQAGIDFNLVSLEGGNANNAIPSSSKATIVLADTDAATEVLDSFAKLFKDSYEAIETDYTFTYGVSDETVEQALDADLSVTFLQLMSSVPNNIHTLLATAEGTESSANLGMVSVTEDELSFTSFMRSSSTFQAEQITLINTTLAELSGFDLDIPVTFATWPLKADNPLADIASEVYYEMTGEEYNLRAIHAGVECGEFAEKNEDLYIISTGVSGGSDGHTTSETMNFDQVDVGFDYLATPATTLAYEG
ncbi:MAG: hypothetical protein LUH36_02990, partial [Oscillospiraceae bacterium]|nr:hypothetical protein [Oscillospiraceae bacterium]